MPISDVEICKEVGQAEHSMLNSLTLRNVGPASEIDLRFGERLNLLTGDNGLGKSFLLDTIWWALTRTWPAEINQQLTSGKKALPHSQKAASISAQFSVKSKREYRIDGEFSPRSQQWQVKPGRPPMPGLVFYAMSDGSFAAWDPARNYWKSSETPEEIAPRPPAYVFCPTEVWDGLKSEDGKWLCNGLIRDWASWQKEKHQRYKNWKILLRHLSPTDDEILVPGNLTRIDLDDVRDMPTLRMPYGHSVPIVHASSGIKRIVALAYFLLWGWNEHRQATRLIRSAISNQVIFLIDEIESHLHPSWQQVIVSAILLLMGKLHKSAHIQLITATHSPLIMNSVEPLFNQGTDSWFNIELEKEEKKVVIRNAAFEKLGEADRWLTGPAFGLSSTRARPYHQLLKDASELFYKKKRTKKEIEVMTSRLVEALDSLDPFLVRWNFLCAAEGLIK